MRQDRELVEDLELRIADLKARLPKHSIPMSMLMELEELEEALERARAAAGEEESA
jgi:hypothetical protein